MKSLVSRGHNSILVVYDRFSKISHFIVITEKITVEGLVRLFSNNIWKLHRLLKSVILNRGPQFVARLMKELNKILGIETKLLTAFYQTCKYWTLVSFNFIFYFQFIFDF